MRWLLRGIQSAVFHYVSCAPCYGYLLRKKRCKEAKRHRRARHKQQSQKPDMNPQPGPDETNPHWSEEIIYGPGPPSRRAKRTNTGSSHKGIIRVGTHSTVVSRTGSSIDVNPAGRELRLSHDSPDDENWNRKRYQREDEHLWGSGEAPTPPPTALNRGSLLGMSRITRPGTSNSSRGNSYTTRKPFVCDPTPYAPVVTLPTNPSEIQWMIQPPPKASIMSGKERAVIRTGSGSGASSRLELGLERQASARHSRSKREHSEPSEMRAISRVDSYSNYVATQRHDRPKTPQTRPPSAASSRAKRMRRDTAFSRTDGSSEDSTETVVHRKTEARESHVISDFHQTPELPTIVCTPSEPSPRSSPVPSLKVVRVRSNIKRLSTVMSSGSGRPPAATRRHTESAENESTPHHRYSSTQSSDTPYLMKHRPEITSSDLSSLNVLQEMVQPRTLLGSRFVSAPLIEARIKLPPSDIEEENILDTSTSKDWTGSGFAVSRGWGSEVIDELLGDPPFLEIAERDPRYTRRSVEF